MSISTSLGSDTPVLTKFSEGQHPVALNSIYGAYNVAKDAANFIFYENVVNGQYGTYYSTANYSNITNTGVVAVSI